MPVLYIFSRSVIGNYRSVIGNYRSVIGNSRSLIDDAKSIIDESRVTFQLVASFAVVIFTIVIFI
jgi:hypothetical protein